MIPEDPNRRHERDSPAALRKQRQDKQQATTQVRKSTAKHGLRSVRLTPEPNSRVGRALGPLTQLSDSSRVSRADLQSVQCQKTFAENCLSEFELELCLALN
jgi:hypothetical protein